MTCEKCSEGEMEATQAPRLPEALSKLGVPVAVVTVLLLGGTLGLGLPLMLDRGVDLSWVLIGVPVALVVCTPVLIMGALRVLSEKDIWRCTSCGYSLDRA